MMIFKSGVSPCSTFKQAAALINPRAWLLAASLGLSVMAAGCAVLRDQQTVGAYVDDVTLTTSVKAKYIEDKTVDTAAIKVETLNGEVQLSGFAKSQAEKSQAERLARQVSGVKSVRNTLVVRP